MITVIVVVELLSGILNNERQWDFIELEHQEQAKEIQAQYLVFFQEFGVPTSKMLSSLIQENGMIEQIQIFSHRDDRPIVSTDTWSLKLNYDQVLKRKSSFFSLPESLPDREGIRGSFFYDKREYSVFVIYRSHNNSSWWEYLLANLLQSLFFILFLGFALFSSILFFINRPIQDLTDVAELLAKGQLTQRFSDHATEGDFGHFSKFFNTFVEELIESVAKIVLCSKDLTKADEKLAVSSMQMVFKLEDVKEEVTGITSSSEEITQSVNSMAEFAHQTSSNIASITFGAGELDRTISIIASNAEEASMKLSGVGRGITTISKDIQGMTPNIEKLSCALKEVASHTQEAIETASEATQNSQEGLNAMKELGSAVTEISLIVQLIGSIASQTNMLALNATIEAASAGETGKGFSIVAAEVKELAEQTTNANDQISKHIFQIQHHMAEAFNYTEVVGKVINHITQINQEIESSVVGQSKAALAITRSIDHVVMSTTSSSVDLQDADRELKMITKSVSESSKLSTDSLIHVGEVSERIRDIAIVSDSVANSIQKVDDSMHHIQEGIHHLYSEVVATEESAINFSTMAESLKDAVSFYDLGEEDDLEGEDMSDFSGEDGGKTKLSREEMMEEEEGLEFSGALS